jgi:hypothetical protein
MDKSDQYRRRAAVAQKMAAEAKDPAAKTTWLEVAETWLRMLPGRKQTASERFDTAERDQGTGQTKSNESH